ncbi:AMP-binding protein [Arthrobacter citreus]|uniref:AMP-binding protein n=1 Tax=Arthrobacter TaxID=1663 RepID=UPI0012641A6E|nr:AMP-binding protein [Arthrobacter gandavensis]
MAPFPPEAYGLSEASGLVSFDSPVPERHPGSAGKPVPGMEVRIADTAGNDVPQGEDDAGRLAPHRGQSPV